MKHLSTTARRAAAVIAAASLTGLIAATAAFAAGSSGTRLAADTAPAAVPACTAADLGAWVAVDQGNGAAGSIYYPLEFTNLSGHTCAMRGFPGVSAIDRNGHQLGSPAGWATRVAAHTVVLAPGATAHTILRYSDATGDHYTRVPTRWSPRSSCASTRQASTARRTPPSAWRRAHTPGPST